MHTPIPWKVSDKFPGRIFPDAQKPTCYQVIADVHVDTSEPLNCQKQDRDNAAFIVRAVNSHEKLVEMVETALIYLTDNTACNKDLLIADLQYALTTAKEDEK